MKQGTIVRRKLLDGTLIGPYLVVLDYIGGGYHRVLSTAILPKENRNDLDAYYPFSVALKSKNFKEISISRIQICDTMFKNIKIGNQTSVCHPATTQWMKIYDREPELVQIRNFHHPDEIMVLKVSSISLKRMSDEKIVRIEFSDKIL